MSDYKQTEIRGGTLWTHKTTGECLLSDVGGWLPGAYANETAARAALRLPYDQKWKLAAICKKEHRAVTEEEVKKHATTSAP